MNFAGVRQLPVVFVCDNNQWAYSTPTLPRATPSSTSPTARPRYGFEGVVVDGTDVLAVYREAKRAIEKAREGGGPTLIECLTLRMEGHAVHDDAFYVPKEMFEEWAAARPDRALPHAGCASNAGHDATRRRTRSRPTSSAC